MDFSLIFKLSPPKAMFELVARECLIYQFECLSSSCSRWDNRCGE